MHKNLQIFTKTVSKRSKIPRSSACIGGSIRKNKPNCRPSAANPKHEFLNPKQRHFLGEHDYAEQTQFPPKGVGPMLDEFQ